MLPPEWEVPRETLLLAAPPDAATQPVLRLQFHSGSQDVSRETGQPTIGTCPASHPIRKAGVLPTRIGAVLPGSRKGVTGKFAVETQFLRVVYSEPVPFL